MTMVIDKPPVIGGSLPPLPPYLHKRGKPERRTIILPDILFDHYDHRIHDHANNWITIVHGRMLRVIGESIFDPNCQQETAFSSTRRYRQWLETYHYPSGIPPHIQFGGSIKSCDPLDATFLERWETWARETFF